LTSGRPAAGEYVDYAADDISAVSGDDAVAALRQQGNDLIASFSDLSDADVAGLTYAPGKWTFKEVLGHLVDDERIFAYRALCIARSDRHELPGFDENAYVAASVFERRSLGSLLAEYRAVRDASLAFFASLTADEWLRRGTVNGYEASVRGLAFHVAGHELHHMRVLEERYLKRP
jgi:uncharacterized damage-inducible protein DinB